MRNQGLLVGGIIGEGMKSFVDSYNATSDRLSRQAEADEERAERNRRVKLEEADRGLKFNETTGEYEDANDGRLNKGERQRVDQIQKFASAMGDQWGMKDYDPLRAELKGYMTRGMAKPTGLVEPPPTGLIEAPAAAAPVTPAKPVVKPRGIIQPKATTPSSTAQPVDEYEKMAREIENAPIQGYDPSKYTIEPKWVREEKLNRAKRAQEVRLKGKEKGVTQSTDGQANAAGFATRVDEANRIFDELESGGFDRANSKYEFQEDVASLPLVGKYTRSMQDERLVRQSQAERNFINAVLRRESGASIAPNEFSSAEQQYFPRPGDTDQVKAQKRQNRLTALANLRAGAGPKAMAQIESERAAVAPSPTPTSAPQPKASAVPKTGPGAIITLKDGRKMRVGADGDSLTEIK